MKLLTRKETPEEVHERNVAEKAERERLTHEGELRAFAAERSDYERRQQEARDARQAELAAEQAAREAERRKQQQNEAERQKIRTDRRDELKAQVKAAEGAVSRLRGEVMDGSYDVDGAIEAGRAMGAVLGAEELAERARERLTAHERQ